MDLRQHRPQTMIAEVAPEAWERISCGDGANGRPLNDCAVVEVRPLRVPTAGTVFNQRHGRDRLLPLFRSRCQCDLGPKRVCDQLCQFR